MLDTIPVKTPFAAHFQLSAGLSPQTKEEKKYMSRIHYASAVRNIMYAMVCTYPDISHAVCVLSRYMDRPGKGYWHAMKKDLLILVCVLAVELILIIKLLNIWILIMRAIWIEGDL